jgi:predicted transcriptional regulator
MKDKRRKWNNILEIIESTKGANLDKTLVVPLEQWNPSILSRKRKELLLAIKNHDIKSEEELAKIVGRKRPNVVNDLKLLEHYGLLKRVRVGKRVIPKIEKTDIIIYCTFLCYLPDLVYRLRVITLMIGIPFNARSW